MYLYVDISVWIDTLATALYIYVILLLLMQHAYVFESGPRDARAGGEGRWC
jgi:hypothetical protein